MIVHFTLIELIFSTCLTSTIDPSLTFSHICVYLQETHINTKAVCHHFKPFYQSKQMQEKLFNSAWVPRIILKET